jgi:hypothetical protein
VNKIFQAVIAGCKITIQNIQVRVQRNFLKKRAINLWETPAQSPVRKRSFKVDFLLIYLIKGYESNRTCLGLSQMVRQKSCKAENITRA